MRPKAAILAVGTELADGQITDRNSGWLSAQLVKSGIDMIEHRVVPDDRALIARALTELSARVELLMVTGGLGPTSDDFTREILAEVFERPLEYSEDAWRRVEEKLLARGVVPKPIQKQQCYFPKGAVVIDNPSGTADGFMFVAKLGGGHSVKVCALPGPPTEVAAVWKSGLEKEIDALVPVPERDTLVVLRTMGKAESEVAELTEPLVMQGLLRVGYRAHMPYVEVKLWFKTAEAMLTRPLVEKIASVLAPWLVNRDDEDVADPLIDALLKGERIRVFDRATQGILQARILERLAHREPKARDLDLTFETSHRMDHSPIPFKGADSVLGWTMLLTADETTRVWRLSLKTPHGEVHELEARPAYNYNLHSERGRRFIAEKALEILGPSFLAK